MLDNDIFLKEICQYFLYIRPAVHVNEKIQDVKSAIREKCNNEISRLSMPSVRLISFAGLKENESSLLVHLQKIFQGVAPFQLSLKDYGNLPTHTVFITVASNNCLRETIDYIKKSGKLSSRTIGPPHFLNDFYIPVANKLKPWQFKKLSLEYSSATFSESCSVNEIQLSKKGHDSTMSHHLCNFLLSGKKTETLQQTSLFY